MGLQAEEHALTSYGKSRPRIVLWSFEKLPCPECGKLCGGRSDQSGEAGATEGLRLHLRFGHGYSPRAAKAAAALT